MAEDEEQGRGFKIQDRRRFDASGEPREDDEEAAASSQGAGAQKPPEPALGSAGAEARRASAKPSEKGHEGSKAGGAGSGQVSFSGFVVGLAQQAFLFLGAAPDPESGLVRRDLPQAAAMIDIISMLQVKCAGNLDENEERLVEEVLYELRMRYVAASRETQPGPGEDT